MSDNGNSREDPPHMSGCDGGHDPQVVSCLSWKAASESRRTYVLSKFQLLGDWLKQGVVKEGYFEKPIHYDTKIAFFQLKMPGAQLLTIPIVITARELASIRIAALSVESMQNHTIEFINAKFAHALMTLTEALEQLEKGQVSE